MTMMKCGHSANAKNSRNKPICVICLGIRDGADIVDENPPDLSGRKAVCSCGFERPSREDLAFFEYRPEMDRDKFYCGCRGWD